MTPSEALTLLAQASYVETTILPASELDRRIKAEVWANLLDDVALGDATAALTAHYRESSKPLTPERIRSRVAVRNPRPVTYLEQVRAINAEPCPHGEPRGAQRCPLCRRGHQQVTADDPRDPRIREAAHSITQSMERKVRDDNTG